MLRIAESDVAALIAQRLLVIQRGPMNSPETWLDVAARLNHSVRSWHEPGGKAGEFISVEGGTGEVWYNTAYAPEVQARVIVHETAHAELCALASGAWCGEVPGWLAGEYHRAGYDDDPADIRHRVCREVERLCFRHDRF